MGRLFNSGWAWVPTTNGCRSGGYSTNSTKCPSGDVPENLRPLSAILSRYALLTSYRWRCRSDTWVVWYAWATTESGSNTAG
ncbi:Uncharacterised protein [Mycobacterium tuberculosis]|nr:Uncharacterised protein [Mycobacterium tuberculosis]